jgi:hypothetical protein
MGSTTTGQVQEPADSLANVRQLLQKQRDLEPQIIESNTALLGLLLEALPRNSDDPIHGRENVYRRAVDGDITGIEVTTSTGARVWLRGVDRTAAFSSVEWELHADRKDLITKIYARFAGKLGEKYSRGLPLAGDATLTDALAVVQRYRAKVDAIRHENRQARDIIFGALPNDWETTLPTDGVNLTSATFFLHRQLGTVMAYLDGEDRDKARSVLTEGPELGTAEMAFHHAIPQILSEVAERIWQELGELAPGDNTYDNAPGEPVPTDSVALVIDDVRRLQQFQRDLEPQIRAENDAVIQLLQDALVPADVDGESSLMVGEKVYERSRSDQTPGIKVTQSGSDRYYIWWHCPTAERGTVGPDEWELHRDRRALIEAVYEKFSTALAEVGIQPVAAERIIEIDDAAALILRYQATRERIREENAEAVRHMAEKLTEPWSMLIPTAHPDGQERRHKYFLRRGELTIKSNELGAAEGKSVASKSQMLTDPEIAFHKALPTIMAQVQQVITQQLGGLA